jgi:hypothetical protein
MKKAEQSDTEPRGEYDFSGGERGKYAKRCTEASNVVVLDPDVVAEFQTPEEVNNALRNAAERGGSRSRASH